MKPSFVIDYNILSPAFYFILVLKSVMTISISFIALFAGMLLKSSKAAIVASFLLVVLMQGNIGGVSLSGNVVMPVILIAVSLVFAVLSVMNANKKDVW